MRHTLKSNSSKGQGLLGLLPVIGILSITITLLGAGLTHDGRVKRNLEGALDYVHYEDSIRGALGTVVLGLIASKTIDCTKIAEGIDANFAPNPLAADPPGRIEYHVIKSALPGSTACSNAESVRLATPTSFYFCIGAKDYDTKRDISAVEIKYEFVNLVDDSPMTCADLQAAVETPAKLITPGAKAFYRIIWQSPDQALFMAGGASNVHTGLVVASAVP